MITETEMYWLTRLYYLQGLVLAASIIFTLLSGVWLVASAICHTNNIIHKDGSLLPVSRKSLRLSIPCFLLSWILIVGACLVPTTKEMCAIKVIPVIVNNEQVQELPDKVLELANEWIDELKPDREK